MWYKGSSRVKPRISSLEEESWWRFGVSGEEVYDGLGVGCVGFMGGYLGDGGWFGILIFFPVLCLLSIKDITK